MALTIVVVLFSSAWFTRDRIVHMPQPDPDAPPCTCGMLPSLPRCEPSMIWSENIPAAPEGEAVAIAQASLDRFCLFSSNSLRLA